MQERLRLTVLVPARLWPRLAYPDKTQEQLYSKPPLKPVSASGPSGFGSPPSPRAGGQCGTHRARRPGSLRYNCVLCSIRRLPCHPDSSGVPAGRAIPHGAAIGAPTRRHPARQLRRYAVLKVWSGRLASMLASAARAPRPSLALSTLPSPRVGAGTLASGSLWSAKDGRHVSLLCSPTRTARRARAFCATR